MKCVYVIEPKGGDDLHDIIVEAVRRAPARFTFNAWEFETVAGETLDQAKVRFEIEHGHRPLTPAESLEKLKKESEDCVRKTEEDMKASGALSVADMCEMEPPWPKTIDELDTYIHGLVDRPHDYNTCVFAMALAGVAAFRYVAKKLGCSGFQASCADLQMLKYTRYLEWGRLLDYSNLLYPQYCDEDNYPSAATLLRTLRNELADMAEKKLAENPSAGEAVLAHWRALVANRDS